MSRHVTRQCTQAPCGLRFPVEADSALGDVCPRCGSPTRADEPAYDSREAHDPAGATGPEVEVVLDNVRSLRNVGSMFRTADGMGVRHMHLCGVTPTPEHAGMAKTSLGAEHAVPWTHHRSTVAAAEALRSSGLRVWALEGGPRSIPLFDLMADLQGPPVALVFGHEVSGIDPRVLDVCEAIARLPMSGVKGSLNVSVALGVATFILRHGPRLRGEEPV